MVRGRLTDPGVANLGFARSTSSHAPPHVEPGGDLRITLGPIRFVGLLV